MRSNARFSRSAVPVIALAAMVLTVMHAAEPAAQPSAISTIACYVALANDLRPLIDATRPDVVAASPECVSQTDANHDNRRQVDITRSNVTNRNAATNRDPVAPANDEVRANGSAGAPNASRTSSELAPVTSGRYGPR